MDERETREFTEDLATVVKAYIAQELAPIFARLEALETARNADPKVEP